MRKVGRLIHEIYTSDRALEKFSIFSEVGLRASIPKLCEWCNLPMCVLLKFEEAIAHRELRVVFCSYPRAFVAVPIRITRIVL